MADAMAGNREEWQQTSEHLRRTASEERRKSERLASQLSRESLQQVQRAIEGILAIPTATALGIGSVTLYVAAFLERGFEVVQQGTEALRSGLADTRREFERQDYESDNRRLRERGEGQGRGNEAQAHA